ncbi:MAG: hypothetical protein OSA98_23520 [Rubripirellula sp.]|nr:hypothetical protein [Rubripirellula sp.]
MHHNTWVGPRIASLLLSCFRVTTVYALRLSTRYDRLFLRERNIFPHFSDRCDRTATSELVKSNRSKDSIRWVADRYRLIVIQRRTSFTTPADTSHHNMSPTPTSQINDLEPGQLLTELEQRQDDVLEQLDALDNQLQEVLRGLGVTLDDEINEELV